MDVRTRVAGEVDWPGRPWAAERTPAAMSEREFERYCPLTSAYICSYWVSKPGTELKKLVSVERSCNG
jgi:hypothetical protein